MLYQLLHHRIGIREYPVESLRLLTKTDDRTMRSVFQTFDQFHSKAGCIVCIQRNNNCIKFFNRCKINNVLLIQIIHCLGFPDSK